MSGRWGDACRALLPSPIPGLVDGSGMPMDQFDPIRTWGIDYNTCQTYCNYSAISLNFEFGSFSNSFTNYILPWLALTAQLPYETGHPMSDFMSLCLALGSPALITYSLSVTILNRLWVRQQFDELHTRARGSNIRRRYPDLATRVRNIQFLLQEAQQVPMRASQESGWLSSLIVSGYNQDWWERLEKNLRASRRGVTFAYIAQMATAGVAWLLTIISSYVSNLGDITTSLAVSAGSLWIWMVPVLIGWITVGTQAKSNTINEALRADVSYRASESPNQTGQYIEEEQQYGIVIRPGLTPQHHRVEHSRLSSTFAGDEVKNGPIYNYARVFTYWQFARNVQHALAATLEKVEAGKACKRRPGAVTTPTTNSSVVEQHRHRPKSVEATVDSWSEKINPTGPVTMNDPSPEFENDKVFTENMDWDENLKPSVNLEGTCDETAAYCDLRDREILAYPAFKHIPLHIKKSMFAASLVALFVQWGTTGPSIMMSFLTPVVGFGCRSTLQLLYGVLGTSVMLLLVLSMWFSHKAMLLYQDIQQLHPGLDLRRHYEEKPHLHVRSRRHDIFCRAAFATRGLAKFLAVANALLLVTSSLLETVGAYDNCFCKGRDLLGVRQKGWMVLFRDHDQLAAEARLPLSTAIAVTTVISVATSMFFYFCCRNTEDA